MEMKQSEYVRLVLTTAVQNNIDIISFDDGGEEFHDPSVDSCLQHFMNVEAGYVRFRDNTLKRTGTMLFLWQGNDETYEAGEEVVSDYHVSLDRLMAIVDAKMEEV
jgi:hypothetical protein